MNEDTEKILADRAAMLGENVLELNPNRSLNYRLTVINIVKALTGGNLSYGEIAVINEESVRELANEWLLVSPETFDLNVSDNIIREFIRYMRGGRADGSVFFIGRGYYDVTVMMLNDQLKWMSTISSLYANDNDPSFRALAERNARKGAELSEWVKKYARWIGLNEDAN